MQKFQTSRLGLSTAPNHQQARKRRRGEVANPANTLDGLVAIRADDIGASDSLIKRYLTENEAIESPSDDQELKVTNQFASWQILKPRFSVIFFPDNNYSSLSF